MALPSCVTPDPTKLSERERYRIRSRTERDMGIDSESNERLLAMTHEELDELERKARRR